MNRLEHLLIIFAEESAEIVQDVAKALRFGLDEGRDIDCTNAQRIKKEFNQLLAVADMLTTEGVDLRDDPEIQQAKKDKVEEYLKYSEKCGTLYHNIPGIRAVREEELEDYFETMRKLIAKRDKRKKHENSI